LPVPPMMKMILMLKVVRKNWIHAVRTMFGRLAW
jgi:hypothetical protein